MEKYIDADKLKELISQVEKEFIEKSETKGYTTLEYRHKAEGLHLALQFIDSLQQEQLEVDLEKEIEWEWVHREKQEIDLIECAEMDKEAFVRFARHFYELGLNGKEE